MKHTTSFIAGLIITAAILMNTSTVFAQEWRVLLGQGLFQENQISSPATKQSVTKNDWLATQTPLLKNTPITSVEPRPELVEGINFPSGYSQSGSWAPLPNPTRNEGFTLFSF